MTGRAGHAPLHVVIKVVEVHGPRGGTMHALVLECGSFVTRRLKTMSAAPERVPCVACFISQQLTLEPVVHQRAAKPPGYRYTKASAEREEAGWTSTTCGLAIRMDDGGWAWRREDITCHRCITAMDAAPMAKRRGPRKA